MVEPSHQPPEVLKYQRDRALNDVPGLPVGLQLELAAGERVYVALSATELAFYFASDFALHYDLEMRLNKVAQHNEYWRRGLSHRGLYTRKRTAEEGGGIERAALSTADTDAVVARAHEWVRRVEAELTAGTATIQLGKPDVETARTQLLPMIQRAATFDVAAAQEYGEQFARIYGRVSVLPSDQYNALVLQVTEGCGFGGCSFCELYEGVRYHAKTADEFRQHVAEVLAFHGESLRSRRWIFLGEANALHAPQRLLVDHLRYLNEVVELRGDASLPAPANWWLGRRRRFEGIASFLDVFTGEPRSGMDYTELRRLGLRRVYIGMESGCDQLLAWLRKPARQELIHRTVNTLKEAHIQVGVILLLGAGGAEFHQRHVDESISSLNAMSLGKGDYIFFSPLVAYPGSAYQKRVEEAGVHRLTPLQMHGQELEIRSGLRFDDQRGKPYLAKYELESFVY